MSSKKSTFPKRVQFAINGVIASWKQESSLRIQWSAVVLLFIFCVITQPSAIWCAIFAAMSGLVISLEMVNSSIEAILDKLHPAQDRQIGFAKDVLAGAVFIASLASLAVFICFLYSKYF